MGFVAKADPEDRTKTIRVEVPDEALGQDTPEQHAARMAAPRPLSVVERLAAIETKIAALEAARAKQ